MSTIQLTSDTLSVTPSPGAHEYNGQHYLTDSNSSRAQVERLVQGTAVATTSGTSITFSGIPAWAKRITVMLTGVKRSGTSNLLFQLGTSGGVVATGYLGSCQLGASGILYTTGFGLNTSNAADVVNGALIISNLTGNTWSAIGNFGGSNSGFVFTNAGSIALASALSQITMTMANGTDTFTAGSVNILYEG